MLLWSATSVHKQPCFSLRGPTFRLRGYVTQILFFLPISDSFMTVLTAWFWFFFSILPICGPRSDIQFFGNATFVYRPGRMYQTCRVSKFLYALFGDWQLSMNLQLFSNNMDFIWDFILIPNIKWKFVVICTIVVRQPCRQFIYYTRQWRDIIFRGHLYEMRRVKGVSSFPIYFYLLPHCSSVDN